LLSVWILSITERLDSLSAGGDKRSMRNIELKARLADLAAPGRLAEPGATRGLGTKHQIDPYFHACTAGSSYGRSTACGAN